MIAPLEASDRYHLAPYPAKSSYLMYIASLLEVVAVCEGASVLRLEKEVHQPEALGLYKAAGYEQRRPFEGYVEDPLSVFMEKRVR